MIIFIYTKVIKYLHIKNIELNIFKNKYDSRLTNINKSIKCLILLGLTLKNAIFIYKIRLKTH